MGSLQLAIRIAPLWFLSGFWAAGHHYFHDGTGTYNCGPPLPFDIQAAIILHKKGSADGRGPIRIGPIYNYYDLGGYLIWRLPSIPVSIDGRTHFHGDERIARAVETWNGMSGWNLDPELSRARLIVGPSNLALVSLLQRDSRCEVAYQDSVASVLVLRAEPEPAK